MKILHLVQSSDTNIGGSLTVARALVKSQRSLGHDSWLVCLYREAGVPRDGNNREFEIDCDVARESRWTHGIRGLRSLLRQQKPDIIHHHDGILWPRIAGLFLGYPRVTHGHLGAPGVNWFAISYWAHLLTMTTTDRVIAISPWVADSWKASGMPEARISLVPNGIDSGRYYRREAAERARVRNQLEIGENEQLLLWVGRLDRKTKGLDRLVAIASKLSGDTRLVIAGDGPDRNWLNAALASADIRHSPLLLGRVDDPSDLFGSADSFLFTSVVESFGLVLLEAICSGLPVYAFGCKGGGQILLRELESFVFPDECVAEMADAISKRAAICGADLIQRVNASYSWPAIALTMEQIYSKCIEAPR